MSISKKILWKMFYPVIGKINTLRDKHKGEICNIYGDGVSIKWFDISKIPENFIFTLGLMPFHKQMKFSKNLYPFIIEPFYFYPYQQITINKKKVWWRNQINPLYSNFIKSNETNNVFINISNLPFIYSQKIKYVFRDIPDKNFEFGRSLEEHSLMPYHGSLRAAITIAIYMGFSRINLIGCDYTHQEPKVRYWYEKGEGKIIENTKYEEEFLSLALQFIDIQNITINNTDSILPSISYNEFTGDKPKYKENTQLLDLKTLKILDTYPIYKIF